MEKVLTLLGFAHKAGQLAIGRSAVLTAKKVYAIVLARDASEKNRLIAQDRQVAVHMCGTKEELGRILGRDQVAIIAILDQGFARAIGSALAD
ncbi:hypothetical protein EH222_12930 [candidate division KSB1 bacterium]|nr:MAG: hypothetical protein EH222_12930 [candidate division KSB1 bacterium]